MDNGGLHDRNCCNLRLHRGLLSWLMLVKKAACATRRPSWLSWPRRQTIARRRSGSVRPAAADRGRSHSFGTFVIIDLVNHLSAILNFVPFEGPCSTPAEVANGATEPPRIAAIPSYTICSPSSWLLAHDRIFSVICVMCSPKATEDDI